MPEYRTIEPYTNTRAVSTPLDRETLGRFHLLRQERGARGLSSHQSKCMAEALQFWMKNHPENVEIYQQIVATDWSKYE